VIGVGSEGRMNLPGTASGNWRWRFRLNDLTPEMSGRLKELSETYER
jgi:4-alpha-glucanotransferase